MFDRHITSVLIATLWLGLCGPLHAAPPTTPERDHQARQPGLRPADGRASRPQESRPALSAQQAGEIARRRYGGQVLDVRPAAADGRPVYRVKLLDRGEVRSVLIQGGQ